MSDRTVYSGSWAARRLGIRHWPAQEVRSLARRAPDAGSLMAGPVATDPATQIVVAFDDNRLASALFGQYGQNLALIERRLGVGAVQPGNHVTPARSREGVEGPRRGSAGLVWQPRAGRERGCGRR